MTKRGKLNIKKLLLAINTFVIIFIVCFYCFRLIKYYKITNTSTKGETGKTLLVDTLIKKKSNLDLTKGLVYDETSNTYRYKGEVKDNYLSYSGNIYRIVGINDSNNIVAVSDKIVTLMYSGLEKGYNDSYINKWLNKSDEDLSGVFESSLYSSDLLDTTLTCSDNIDNLENITCEDSNDSNMFSLLSLYDYKEAGGKSSYLNNGEGYFLATTNSSNNYYYITPDGDITVIKNTNTVGGVRPVITINYNTELISGDGKSSSPYVIESHDIKTINDTYIGSYVSFNGVTYRVISKDTDSVRVASSEVLTDCDGKVSTYFAKYTSDYALNTNTVGHYLNNTYLESIDNNDLIVKSKWPIAQQVLGNLDYAEVYSKTIEARVGMLGFGDFYVQDLKNIFTVTRGLAAENLIMIIQEDGTIYTDQIRNEHNVRSAFNLKSDIKVSGGKGSLKDPYVLSITKAGENSEQE